MLQSARIRSITAALMRALAAGASVQHTPRTMRSCSGGHSEDKIRLAVKAFVDCRLGLDIHALFSDGRAMEEI
jgi:hypothetical protein